MNRSAQELALILFVCFVSAVPSTAPAPAPARRPRSLIEPGWWWYWFPPDVTAQWSDFQRRRRGQLRVFKSWGGPSLGASVVLFEVTAALRWTLPGLPERAERGADTDLADIAGVIPAPPSALRRAIEAAAKGSWEYLQEVYRGRPRQPFP